jgi:hypothetical protein
MTQQRDAEGAKSSAAHTILSENSGGGRIFLQMARPTSIIDHELAPRDNILVSFRYYLAVVAAR